MLKRIGYSLSVSLPLIFMTSSPTLAKDTARVTVGVAEDWQQGIEKSLYCQGSTPFYQTISSHAHASVNWVLPVGSYVEKGTVLAQQDDFYLRQQLTQIDTNIAIVDARHQFAESEFKRFQSMTEKDMVAYLYLFWITGSKSSQYCH